MAAISADDLHRTAKYFMDNGQAATHAEAMGILESFTLTIWVGDSIGDSVHEQTALLTLVNLAARTFLGGVQVVELPNVVAKTPLYSGRRLRDVVVELGGTAASADAARSTGPVAIIGDTDTVSSNSPQWRLTWSGWRGGVVMEKSGVRLDELNAIGLAPVLAAGACASEVFAYLSETHIMAGRRSSGMSLWTPETDWLLDADEPPLSFLPSSLWLIGLGNLGQAFAWTLASLKYGEPRKAEVVLQDMDRIAASNHSTSLLSFPAQIGTRKTRVVAEWLELRGFDTIIEERPFGEWSHRTPSEPGVALCGVDNAEARAALEAAGFGLVVEAGLGAGLDSFRSIALHTLPASRSAGNIWGKQIGQGNPSFRMNPAYVSLSEDGMDDCGLVRLASRTIAVPFVGLIAACLVVAEVLRRLHGGMSLELLSVSTLALCDAEMVLSSKTEPYAFGYVEVEDNQSRNAFDGN